MVTASHNPPSDNAVKVYWSTGGQVVPPHDKAIVERVMNVDGNQAGRFSAGGRRRAIVLCKDEIDAAFIQKVADPRHAGTAQSENSLFATPRRRRIRRGAGGLVGRRFSRHRNLPPASAAQRRFSECARACLQSRKPGHLRHADQPGDGEPGPSWFWPPIPTATAWDAPRRSPRKPQRPVGHASPGNQLSALLTDYVCASRTESRHANQRALPRDHARHDADGSPHWHELRRADARQRACRLQVDCPAIDAAAADKFLFGTEESHGFFIGQYVRDKDGARRAC